MWGGAMWGGRGGGAGGPASPLRLQHTACSDFPKMPVYAAPERGQSLLIESLCVFLDSEGLDFPMLISQHVN